MKKLLIILLVIFAFILGITLSEVILSSVNSLFNKDLFKTQNQLEKKLSQFTIENQKLKNEVNKKINALKNLLEEMDEKDYNELAKENLLTSSGETEKGKIRLKSALNEIYFKSSSVDDEGVNSVRKEFNNKIKTMKRQAYGFRDLEFFKLKIMAIHKSKYALVG